MCRPYLSSLRSFGGMRIIGNLDLTVEAGQIPGILGKRIGAWFNLVPAMGGPWNDSHGGLQLPASTYPLLVRHFRIAARTAGGPVIGEMIQVPNVSAFLRRTLSVEDVRHFSRSALYCSDLWSPRAGGS
jgi:hypothetical protein